MMASLLQYLGVVLLLTASHGQETNVMTLPGIVMGISNDNGTSVATATDTGAQTDVKPPTTKEPTPAKEPEIDVPVERKTEDPKITVNQIKGSPELKPPFIAEPDAIKKDLGGRCTTDTDCLPVNDTHCKDKVCVCRNGFIPSKHSLDKCVKVPSGLYDFCEEEAQCSHAVPASDCRDGLCQCPLNSIFQQGRCWEKQMLGGVCNITEQCEGVTSATCTQGVCDCKPPLTPSPSNKCLEVAGKEYKAACEEDIQCSLSYGDEARCSHGQCRCTNNYHYNGTTCVIDKKLGEPCLADTQCDISEINNEEAARICLDNVCTCAIGYSNLSGEEICSKSSGEELAVCLSWILCLALVKFYFD